MAKPFEANNETTGSRNCEKALPLSTAQAQLCFLQVLAPHNTAYNGSIAFRLEGNVRVDLISAAIVFVVRRHAVLRSRFHIANGEALQCEHVDNLPSLEIHNVIGAGLEEVMHLVEMQAEKPFLLSDEPPIRCHIWKMSPTVHVLLVTAHHAAADGHSIEIFCRELGVAYSVMVRGQEPELPAIPWQYGNYAMAQQAWLASPEFDSQLSEYAEPLKETSQILNLPYDRQRPNQLTYGGASYAVTVEEEVWTSVRSLAKSMRITPFVVLLSAFEITLQRYCDNNEILLGIPMTDRNRRDYEGVIGMFANVVVMKAKLTRNATFRSAITSSRRELLKALRYTSIPFEKLVERLSRTRDPSIHPVVQVIVGLSEQSSSTLQLSDLAVSPLSIPVNTAKVDLYISNAITDGRLAIKFIYNKDLFDALTIRDMATQFASILSEGIRNPEQLTYTLASPSHTGMGSEKHCLKCTAIDASIRVSALFERQAKKTPHSLALKAVDRELTYAELYAQVRCLAERLRAAGAHADTVVGLYGGRTIEAIIGMLAVLESGAAYLPLDPDLPDRRLRFMLDDARPVVLLTSKVSRGRADELFLGRILVIDDDVLPSTTRIDECPSAIALNGLQLAYLIYTSGSTGQPKGVQISHLALSNFVNSMTAESLIQASDILLSVTTLSFDIAALEVFLPLVVGAQIVIAPKECTVDGGNLAHLLETSRATVMQSTPSTWRMLLNAGWRGSPNLVALCGGEALDPLLATDLLERTACLWNLYGPTEATIWSTFGKIDKQSTAVGIGEPIGNTDIYILDKSWNIVPKGVTGELYIGGSGLSRGYHQKPALTAGCFIPDNFSGRLGARLYATGDLARQLPDGQIRLLGRRDHQVKIRGHRIELGEIEEVLTRHPRIESSAVIWAISSKGNGRLIAYLKAKESLNENVEWSLVLSEYLRKELPDYAIPTTFVQMNALPVNTNGKLDRNALPLPALDQASGKYGDNPQGTTEVALSKIWSEVLEIGEIGRSDDFFALGGHSLLAGKITSRVRQTFGVEISYASIFEHAALFSLAAHIDTLPRHSIKHHAIAKTASAESYPLSFPQRRLWFLHQLTPSSDSYHLSAAFRIKGHLDFEVLRRSLVFLISRHDVLRAHVVLNADNRAIMKIDDDPKVDACLCELAQPYSDDRANEIITKCISTTFDLETDPMLRVRCAEFQFAEYVIVFALHHIVADGWSVRILIQELSTIYRNLLINKDPDLSPLTINYVDWATWQTSDANRESIDDHRQFWCRLLDKEPRPLQFQVPTLASCHPGKWTVPIHVGTDVVLTVQECARQENASMFMVLLAAFVTVLSVVTGSDDIIIGTDVSGRQFQEMEDLVGLFVNQIPLRITQSDGWSFAELIDHVRDAVLEGFAHQAVPFEDIVRACRPRRLALDSSIFNVKFVLQDADLPRLELSGVIVEPIKTDNRDSKFDMLANVAISSGCLDGYVECKKSFVSEAVATELVEQFQNVIVWASANPGTSLQELKTHLLDVQTTMRMSRECSAEIAIVRALSIAHG